MAHPPPVTKKERKVLEVIGRGHPERTMTVRTRGGASATLNALEWSEVQIGAGLAASEFYECIANLGAGKLIDNGIEFPGMFARLRGAEEKYYFWITAQGRRFLAENPQDALPDVPPLPTRAELKPSDIEDAVQIYENSLSPRRYVKPDEAAWAHKVAWAEGLLDDDIKSEIAKAAQELEAMWVVFERMFGHRGPAEVGPETEIRDPVVTRTVVRVFRAMDEQCKRLGFPPSWKPESWLTRYNGGDVGLEPAPWEAC